MKYFFIVQGEGRGHMTQALALSQILRSAGHQITRAVVGKSARRELPAFFQQKMNCRIDQLDSPNFVTDKQHKSVKPFKTVLHSVYNSKTYQQSLRELHRMVKEDQPDTIINFYDFLGGLYRMYKKPRCQTVCIAHQFLASHPEFEFPRKRKLDRASLKAANKIARFGADKVLALSFQPFEDVPKKKLSVVPPLLRREVLELVPRSGDHFLVYMVNPGYAAEVDQFHEKNPDIPLHCFWDKKDAPPEWQADPNLTYHRLDDLKFISLMASSKGYVTTAGFESVCEAMYLGKPVLMIPVEGHYEQACNAIDAHKAGAGIYHDTFEISKLAAYLPDYRNISPEFRKWANKAPEYFLKHLA